MMRGSRTSRRSRPPSITMREVSKSNLGTLAPEPKTRSGFCRSRRGHGSAFRRRCFRLFLCRAIPVKRALQALFKCNGRLVAKEFAGLRNVRLRVADIAVARWFVLRFEALTGNLIEKGHGLIQGETSADTNVEHLSGNIGSFPGHPIGFHPSAPFI